MAAGESLERKMVSGLAKAEKLEAEACRLRAGAERDRMGLVGERAFEAWIAPFERKGWRVLRDRRLLGSPANVDHVLVGPPGVIVVDSKNYSGRLKHCADGTVLIGGYPRGREIAQVARYAQAVQVSCWQRFPGVVVVPAVCFTRDVGLTAQVMSDGVLLTQPELMTPWLDGTPQRLTPQQVWELAEHLENAHPSRAEPAVPRQPHARPQAPVRRSPRSPATNALRLGLLRVILMVVVGCVLLGFVKYGVPSLVKHPKSTPSRTPATAPSR